VVDTIPNRPAPHADRAASGPEAPSAPPTGPRRRRSPRPPLNVCGRLEIAPSPAVQRRREARLIADLVGALLAHAEHLGDLNDSKEFRLVMSAVSVRTPEVGGDPSAHQEPRDLDRARRDPGQHDLKRRGFRVQFDMFHRGFVP
jgi:hypothetical protein